MVKGSIVYAVFAALLFGAATPASKALLSGLTSFQLAGLLYLGAAIGVAPVLLKRRRVRLPETSDRRNWLALLGAISAGGICGPVLLLFALRSADAASVSLWLNFELAATALLGVIIFRDNLNLPGWAGVVCTFSGAVVLSFGGGSSGFAAGALVLAACVFWGLDNHLSALIDAITPAESTFWKGLVAGGVNSAIGFAMETQIPSIPLIAAALAVGAFAYGASIALYITSAHALGCTRAQIAFSSAPFFGVLLSALLLDEKLTGGHIGAGLLFVAAVGLLILERHSHIHEHGAMEHEHIHTHGDFHHVHDHIELPHPPLHAHRHAHVAEVHDHSHTPDLHHRHEHKS